MPSADLRAAHAADPAPARTVPVPGGVGPVFSPLTGTSLLDWYADVFDAAVSSSHVTGAFGLNAVFRDRLAGRPLAGHPHGAAREGAAAAAARSRAPTTTCASRRGATSAVTRCSSGRPSGSTGFNNHVRYIHTKIVLVDPLGPDPTILTGSANYSDASTTTNEENTLRHPGRAHPVGLQRAVRRVADIYLTEYHRLFMHFAFRAMAQNRELNTGVSQWSRYLDETEAWTDRYYVADSWRAPQRRLFSGPEPPSTVARVGAWPHRTVCGSSSGWRVSSASSRPGRSSPATSASVGPTPRTRSGTGCSSGCARPTVHRARSSAEPSTRRRSSPPLALDDRYGCPVACNSLVTQRIRPLVRRHASSRNELHECDSAGHVKTTRRDFAGTS